MSLKLLLHVSVYNAQSKVSYVVKTVQDQESPATQAVI